MDSEKIKKLLPFLKDVDLEDENNKKKIKYAFMIFGLVLMFIILLAVSAGKKSKADVPPVDAANGRGYENHAPEGTYDRQESKRSGLLEIQEGENLDDATLGASDMISAREQQRRKRGAGLNGLYDRTSFGEDDSDPLSALTADADRKTDDGDDELNPSKRLAEAEERRMKEMAERERRAAAAAAGPVSESQSGSSSAPKTRKITGTNTVSSNTQKNLSGNRQQPVPEPEPEPEPVAKQPAQEPRTVRKSGGISSLDDWGTVDGIGGLDGDDQYVVVDDSKPIKVMFVREQKITTGSRVALRLLDDIAADGMLIPKNTHLSAQCSIGERLDIRVNNIEINGKIITLGYTAFDNDGNEGLYCPISAEAKSAQKTKQNLSSVGQAALSSAMSTIGGYLPTAVNSGVNVVKSEVGNVEATVNAGYTFFLLKDSF